MASVQTSSDCVKASPLDIQNPTSPNSSLLSLVGPFLAFASGQSEWETFLSDTVYFAIFSPVLFIIIFLRFQFEVFPLHFSVRLPSYTWPMHNLNFLFTNILTISKLKIAYRTRQLIQNFVCSFKSSLSSLVKESIMTFVNDGRIAMGSIDHFAQVDKARKSLNRLSYSDVIAGKN